MISPKVARKIRSGATGNCRLAPALFATQLHLTPPSAIRLNWASANLNGHFFKRNLRFSCVLYCRPNVWCSLLFLRFRWRLRVQAPPVAQASGRSYHEPDLASVVRSYKFERTFLIVRATRPTTAVFPFVLLLSLCLISCENFFQAPFFESRLFPAWGKPQLARTSQRNVTFES